MMHSSKLALIVVALAACSTKPKATAPKPAAANVQAVLPGADQAASKTVDTRFQALVDKHEDCAKQGKVWLPQLDQSKLATEPAGSCSTDLAHLCCTVPKLQSLFQGPATAVQDQVQPLFAKKYQIYDCSQENDHEVRVHFLKVDGAVVGYTQLTIDGLLPADGSDVPAQCQRPSFSSLLPAAAGAVAAPSSDFAAKINPILVKSCGSGSCHSSGSPFAVFVDHEDTVQSKKDVIVSRLQAGTMPPSGHDLSADDKATLLAYLAAAAAPAPAATPAPAPGPQAPAPQPTSAASSSSPGSGTHHPAGPHRQPPLSRQAVCPLPRLEQWRHSRWRRRDYLRLQCC